MRLLLRSYMADRIHMQQRSPLDMQCFEAYTSLFVTMCH
jgi:hypothetical protein